MTDTLSNEAAQRLVREMIEMLTKGGWTSEDDAIDARIEEWLLSAEHPVTADRAPVVAEEGKRG